jgi:hypothetical protein
MENRRRSLRTAADVLVELSHPGFGILNVRASDLSEGGMAVDMGHHIAPPVGTEVKVLIKRHTGIINSEPVAMRVMHIDNKRVGLMFV